MHVELIIKLDEEQLKRVSGMVRDTVRKEVARQLKLTKAEGR